MRIWLLSEHLPGAGNRRHEREGEVCDVLGEDPNPKRVKGEREKKG